LLLLTPLLSLFYVAQSYQVAVKRIFIGQASPAQLATILREAQILEAVAANCRHACRFLGYTIKGFYFCLVMHR
jgi:hypothetical protein